MADYESPPPLFDRGPGPLVRLILYLSLALAFFIIDLRFKHVQTYIRPAIAVWIDPLQQLMQLPWRLASTGRQYLRDVVELRQRRHRLGQQELALSERLARIEQLDSENRRLRTLLQLPIYPERTTQVASILGARRTPQSQKLLINRGQMNGVKDGQPVIDPVGVIGQVTRSLPVSAEVTLITDSNQATPVESGRTGLRSVAFGTGDGLLELRYVPANADVRVGDVIVTSGLDGIYPAGLAVGQVIRIDSQSAHAFGRIICAPLAGVEHYNEVVVLSVPEHASQSWQDKDSKPTVKKGRGEGQRHGH